MEEKTKVTPDEEALAEALKGFTDIDPNAGEAIPSKTDIGNAESENAVEKLTTQTPIPVSVIEVTLKPASKVPLGCHLHHTFAALG